MSEQFEEKYLPTALIFRRFFLDSYCPKYAKFCPLIDFLGLFLEVYQQGYELHCHVEHMQLQIYQQNAVATNLCIDHLLEMCST